MHILGVHWVLFRKGVVKIRFPPKRPLTLWFAIETEVREYSYSCSSLTLLHTLTPTLSPTPTTHTLTPTQLGESSGPRDFIMTNKFPELCFEIGPLEVPVGRGGGLLTNHKILGM